MRANRMSNPNVTLRKTSFASVRVSAVRVLAQGVVAQGEMQLSTQNRADDFDQNQCEAIAAAVGGFARELTYEYGLCKFVEVSVLRVVTAN